MSISSEINRITNARDDIGDAIEEMGVTVPSGTQIDGMASLIRSGVTGHIQDTNNPHQVTASQAGAAPKTAGIYYTTCSTAGDTQQKDITISDITSLDAGLQIRVRFAYNQGYNGTPTLKLNNFAAKEIRRDVNNAAGRYEWRGTETLDLVYDGTYWIIVDGGTASVSYYGVTKLNNAVDSSSEVLAASSKAIKTVNDSLTSHTGNASNPHSVTAAQVGAAPTTAGVYYGVCETSGSTADKDVTISGITSLYDGLQISVKFIEACTVASARLSVNNLGYKNIIKTRTGPTASGEWYSGAVLNLVYYSADSAGANDGWRIVNGGTATTTFYGRTKLSSAINSTSSTEAATPSAVKQAYDLAASKPDLEDVVPVYGMGENLLDNWYFLNPINQRGQSSYTFTTASYAISRWKLNRGTITLGATGINFVWNGSTNYATFLQPNARYDAVVGRKVTLSALTADGDFYSETITVPSSGSLETPAGDPVRFIATASSKSLGILISTTTGVVIVAVKAELGTQQTLCHNEGTDANPAWVLNEIPDYEEELLKCQTSTADTSDYYANWNIGFNVSSYNFINNWYFINPVNQRKITSGSTGAFIDRWRSGSATGFTFAVNSSGLVLTNTNTSSAVLITQELSAAQQLLGRTVCLSILTSEGLYWATGTLPSSFNSAVALEVKKGSNAIAQINLTSSAMQARIRCPSSTTLTVIAIKLEIGVHQTLAHIENDVWVPNEIPDYEEELIRCQTSTAYSDDTYANKTLATTQQIATIETSNTASQAYHIGQYFCKDGLLYRVTAEISSGAAFTVGTNCVSTTATTWLPQELAYNLTTNAKFTSLSGKVTRVGNMVILSFRGVASAAISSNTEIIRIPYNAPGSDGQILSMWRANTAYTCRINAGTISSVPNGRIYTNTNISANDNISITGIYFL